MLADCLYFNFYLYIAAGLCLPSKIVKIRWNTVYYCYMIMSDTIVIINLITLSTNVLAQNIPLSKRCFSGFTTLATALSVTKLVACYFYKDKLSEYLTIWDGLIERDANEDLKEALLNNKKQIKIISFSIFVFMVVPMVPWASLPLFIKILSYFIPDLEQSYQFIAIPAQFPFDCFSSPAFEFITIFQGLSAVAVNAKLMAYDCLIYGLISCQIVQLKHLKKRFKHIINPTKKHHKKGKLDKVLFEKCDDLHKNKKEHLAEWVEQHSDLIKLCNNLNLIYSPVLLVQFLFNMLMLCSNAFVVAAATLTKLEIMFSAGYVIGTITQLYMLCWLGEEITHQSITLTRSGFWELWYGCPWFKCNDLKIIFERTKFPLKVSTFGTVHLSIETFKSIIGTAYSYFMVLNQIKKNE